MDKLFTYFRLQVLLVTLCYCLSQVTAVYPPNFYHNDKQCLYAFMADGGEYSITFPEIEPQKGPLKGIVYDKTSKCTDGITPGLLVVNFNTGDNFMESISIEFEIKNYPANGYWVINKATLKIKPVNKQLYPTDTIELNPIDIYAGDRFSYSCNTLVLQNSKPSNEGPHFKITLKRFQVQPFKELPTVIFAPSYDCSVWLTMPLIMGALLMLFIIFTVLIGVYLLVQQGNQGGGDLKFSKQSGMLMNQAQLDATKG